METKHIETKSLIALNEDKDEFYFIISIVNDLLKSQNKSIKFELEQQNKYIFNNEGKGSLLTMIIKE